MARRVIFSLFPCSSTVGTSASTWLCSAHNIRHYATLALSMLLLWNRCLERFTHYVGSFCSNSQPTIIYTWFYNRFCCSKSPIWEDLKGCDCLHETDKEHGRIAVVMLSTWMNEWIHSMTRFINKSKIDTLILKPYRNNSKIWWAPENMMLTLDVNACDKVQHTSALRQAGERLKGQYKHEHYTQQ